jgi:hypothetical protein
MFRTLLGMACAVGLAACSGRPPPESITPVSEAQLTPELRADYDVFAQRCSKCHSLAKPLNSHVDDDDVWIRYVAKMRRQPASGISERDGEAILRFLHVLVEQERAKNAEKSK